MLLRSHSLLSEELLSLFRDSDVNDPKRHENKIVPAPQMSMLSVYPMLFFSSGAQYSGELICV